MLSIVDYHGLRKAEVNKKRNNHSSDSTHVRGPAITAEGVMQKKRPKYCAQTKSKCSAARNVASE